MTLFLKKTCAKKCPNSQCDPTDFHWKRTLAKLHIAVINQPQRTCPVWIISQLSSQRPCFLCSEFFGRTPTKAQASFLLALLSFPSLSLHHSDLLLASFLSVPSKRSKCGHPAIIEKTWDEMKAKNIVKTKGEMRPLLMTNWPAELYFFALVVRQRNYVFAHF